MESPMSGYDIKKHVNSALGAATQASYGTLYPTLHKLLAEGAVDVQEVMQQGRPSKKIYRITDQGRREVQKWFKQPTAADQIRREFLLKLYLARDLPAREVLALVATRREETEAMLTALQTEKNSVTDPKEAWVMDYALSVCQAEINWLEKVESQIPAAEV